MAVASVRQSRTYGCRSRRSAASSALDAIFLVSRPIAPLQGCRASRQGGRGLSPNEEQRLAQDLLGVVQDEILDLALVEVRKGYNHPGPPQRSRAKRAAPVARGARGPGAAGPARRRWCRQWLRP